MHSNEKPIILIVTTLFLAFTLVYMMFFRLRDTSSDEATTITPLSGIVVSGSTTSDALLNSLLTDTSGSLLSGNFIQSGSTIMTGASSGRVVLQTGDDSIPSSGTRIGSGVVQGATGSNSYLSPQTASDVRYKRIDTISGVAAWYNSVKIAEVLGLDVQVVFADTGNILYAYLGTGELKQLASTVQRLQGNMLAIETQVDIIKNGLPGDRIRFINIPQLTFIRTNGVEQKMMVAMIIDIDDDQWLIQAPYDRYHASKKHMIQIFDQLYK